MTDNLTAARDAARMTAGSAWASMPQSARLGMIADALSEIRQHRASGGACCR